MDINAYIESGVLEQYVLGQLSQTEGKEVEAMARQYPEVKKELEAIELAMEVYAMSRQVKPTEGLYDGIKPRLQNTAPEAPSGKSSGRSPWISGLAIVGLAVAIFMGWKWNQTQQELDQLRSTAEDNAVACDSIDERANNLEEQLRILRNAANQNFFMLGTDLAPQAIAAVYVNPEEQKAFLDIIALPAPPTDKQYQLWALVDGQPVDMGVFELDFDADGFAEVPYIADAGAYAVTLEPSGGSINPSLDQLYVISQG